MSTIVILDEAGNPILDEGTFSVYDETAAPFNIAWQSATSYVNWLTDTPQQDWVTGEPYGV